MTTTIDAHDGIRSTLEQLQDELPELELRKQQLEQDLAAVIGRLEAARAAVASLRTLSAAGLPATEPAVQTTQVVEPARSAAAQPQVAVGEPHRDAALPAPRQAKGKTTPDKTAGRKKAGTTKAHRLVPGSAKKAAPSPKAVKKTGDKALKDTAPVQRAKGLTDGVVTVLGQAKGAMKAGEVNQALGRPDTPGQIEAVRGTLERLVKAFQVQRTGRGLYEAVTS